MSIHSKERRNYQKHIISFLHPIASTYTTTQPPKMAAGDLNLLKSWNPKLMKNRKKVWETEQDLLKEEQKFKERQQELEKERELESLATAGESQKKKKTGLEWMYDDRIGNSENEDYLLGKKKLDANVIKKTTERTKTQDTKEETKKTPVKRTYDYSNDDPMAKFNKMAKAKKSKLAKKPKGKVAKPGNKPAKKQQQGGFDY